MNKITPILFFLFSISVTAQEDCFLGVGGNDDQTIAEVFNLNEEQIRNLKNWGAELKYRNEIFVIRAEYLLKNHPNSSHEDLLKMSYIYRGHLDSMRGNLRMIDKRMLGTFNNEQYNLYIQLCNSVLLSPIFANRSESEKRK
ncbi:hypothetical protein [Croceivirga thetidis]|uniref:Uncharacterized protein n=1 Tax=Croceivirga thetidis TaxID=2721623 RepID=A0ABX1GSN0_9FLAO|nr:hypothetical protein [Croceivirga thetidis]NKI32962.1 hypothetical protein [Croceivirga thetidis]